jgi:membrane protease YdiL (CAAX protease family)
MDDAPHEPEAPSPPGRLSPGRALVLYAIFAAVAWGASAWILDRPPLTSPEAAGLLPLHLRAAWGAGVGVAVVLLDMALERLIPALRRMGEAMREVIGPLTTPHAVLYAVTSALGEELLFRGFAQAWLGIIPASLFFGLLHIGPDRRLWPWPLLACAMGFAFGALFDYTGDVLAPVLAHFTINYFGFMRLRRAHQVKAPPPSSDPPR